MTGENRLGPGTIVKLIMLSLAGLFLLWTIPNSVVHLDATQLMVVQYPSGHLVTHIQPGFKGQYLGSASKYGKRSQFWFSSAKDQGQAIDQSIRVRFNDGGHAGVSGSLSWEMPTDEKHLLLLHTKYGSQQAVEQQLIRTVVEKAVYMTGPLMSSKESSAERRNDLLHFIEDQVQNGVYQTKTEQVKEPDPLTGQLKTVSYVRLVEKDGVIQRQEDSPLNAYGIKTSALSLNNVKYDDEVEAQIKKQQEATMQVQTAIANAKKAEQDAITAEKEGEALAATAKWKQEVIKAQVVTEAQQQLEVARLATQTAEQEKRKQILLGEGDAERRKLVMTADGALTQKLNAWLESQKIWAGAFKDHQGQLVPSVVMGTVTGAGQQSGVATAQSFMEILGIKAAQDLALDMKMNSANRAGPTKTAAQ